VHANVVGQLIATNWVPPKASGGIVDGEDQIHDPLVSVPDVAVAWPPESEPTATHDVALAQLTPEYSASPALVTVVLALQVHTPADADPAAYDGSPLPFIPTATHDVVLPQLTPRNDWPGLALGVCAPDHDQDPDASVPIEYSELPPAATHSDVLGQLTEKSKPLEKSVAAVHVQEPATAVPVATMPSPFSLPPTAIQEVVLGQLTPVRFPVPVESAAMAADVLQLHCPPVSVPTE